MEQSLYKDLKGRGWHSSIMTTYSVDPVFYDGFVERALHASGCTNNILLADASMLTRALEATPEAFRRAGTRYAIVPVRQPDCFHPKLHLRLGKDKARLIIGSANVTAAGWCRNVEALAALDWTSDANSGFARVIRKAYDYVMHWLQPVPGRAIEHKRDLLMKSSPWLDDYEPNREGIVLLDGSVMDLICDRGGDSPSMHQQLVERIDGGRVRNLVVISPYWDRSLRGLRDLRKSLGNCPVTVALKPELNTFPVASLRADDIEFVQLENGSDRSGFLHAKIILVETAKADHLLIGSANCSDDALGSSTEGSRNAEACVYRRFPKQWVRSKLSLDLTQKLKRHAISSPTYDSKSAETHDDYFDPGHIELSEGVLHWYPPPVVDGSGARLQLGDAEPRVTKEADHFCATAPQVKGALIARVLLASGRRSRRVIVHQEAELLRALPNQLDPRIRDVLKGIFSGFEDLLDLLPHAHLIFAKESPPKPGGGSKERRNDDNPGAKGTDFDTPEEFRQAVIQKTANGRSRRYATSDEALLQILALIRRGSGGVSAHELDDSTDEDERALLEGEREDGQASDESEVNTAEITQPNGDTEDDRVAPPAAKDRIFSAKDFERRRRVFMRTIKAFDGHLKETALDSEAVSANIAARTAIMVQLMFTACRTEYRIDSVSEAYRRMDPVAVHLMKLFSKDVRDDSRSVAYWLASMLSTIWIGRNNNALVWRIRVAKRYETLPDDIVEWIVSSRWAIGRALLSAAGANTILAKQNLPSIAKGVFDSTGDLGPIDREAETGRMLELDAQFGFSASETEDLLRLRDRLAVRGADRVFLGRSWYQ